MQAREIAALGEQVLAGREISYGEALALENTAPEDVPLLAAWANKVRAAYCGSGVDMCGIINARSGRCSEDCKFCAQAARHRTAAPVYPLRDAADIVAAAQEVARQGARRVSIVTSGKGMERDPDFSRIVAAIKAIQAATGLAVCANLGTLTPAQARTLAAAGVKRYAHNIETSARFYPTVCTTHPYADRLATVRAAKAAGLELCTGGIIGMGESWQDRVDMAFTLRELAPASVPINILNPIKGTPLAHIQPPPPLEIIKTFAMFRLVLPDKIIRPAGGRELNLRDMQGALLLAGANGLIVGNYLTFSGRDTAADFQMVADAGMEVGGKG